jgi:hypothetical protein
MQGLISDLQKGVSLKTTAPQQRSDRSEANLALSGADVLEDEAERWKYFFDSGCSSWFDDIAEHTFSSTFCTLEPAEARVVVDHWEARRRALAAAAARGEEGASEGGGGAVGAELVQLRATAVAQLQPLRERLEVAVRAECAKSVGAGRAFVKLSTRSPKDSKIALARAAAAFRARMAQRDTQCATAGQPPPDHNERWVTLSEEVGRAGAVDSASGALELLLDSERVFEDLEYALRGPPQAAGGGGAAPPPGCACCRGRRAARHEAAAAVEHVAGGARVGRAAHPAL